MKAKIQLLTQILIKLKQTRWMSEGILLLLQNNELSEAEVDRLIYFLSKIIRNVDTKNKISDQIEDFRETSLDERQLLFDLKMRIG